MIKVVFLLGLGGRRINRTWFEEKRQVGSVIRLVIARFVLFCYMCCRCSLCQYFFKVSVIVWNDGGCFFFIEERVYL